jgi:hypothetical protein
MNYLCGITFTFPRIINTTVIIDLITLLSICLLGNLHLCLGFSVALGSVRERKFVLSPKFKWCAQGICVLYDTSVTVLLLAPFYGVFFVKPAFSIYFRRLLVTTPSTELTKRYIDTLFSFQIFFFISRAKFS